jgi:hypothetical protein
MPHQFLWDTNAVQLFDSLFLEHIDISYSGVMPGRNYFSKVSFKDVKVTASFNNNEGVFKTNSKLENLIPFDCNISLMRKNQLIKFTGSLPSFNLTQLNPMLISMAGLKIKSGISDGLNFSATGNSYSSYGSMIFKYHDLHLGFVKTGNLSKGKKILFNRAIDIIVPSSNPKEDGKPRKGDVTFKRDPNRGVFHYMWKSVQTGLHTSLKLPASSVKP